MDDQAMGKSMSVRERVMLEMKTQLFPSSPEETDPRLLEALASLNQHRLRGCRPE